MAAPSGTVWGGIIKGSENPNGRQGRIGIYVKVTSTNTKTTVNVQGWFWSIYSVSDGSNKIYYDIGTSVSSATTNRGSVTISHTVATGAGWSTSNQTKLFDVTNTYNRGTSAVTYKVYAKFNNIDILQGSMLANTSFTVPALATYTITYNANGGSGAPGSQTKTHGVNLTISSSIPTRTGYTFNNWALSKTDADASKWYYTPGSSCGRNADTTLYAVWELNTYPVNYNANGGTGAPASQTKTYGQPLTLSSTIPTRENYSFKGWATAASATTAEYANGANYTANSAVTLYAVWELAYTKPRIKNFSVFRCSEEDDSIDDNGAALGVSFEWATDRPVQSMTLSWTPANDSGYISDTLDVSGTSGTYVNQGIRAGFSLETTYQIALIVRDGDGDCYSAAYAILPGANFAIDFKAGGKGVAFNKPAESDGVLDVNLETYLRGGLRYGVLGNGTDLDSVFTTGFYVGSHNFTYVNCPIETGNSFTLEVMSGGDVGQFIQRLTMCNKDRNIACERAYYESRWGEWIKTSPTTIYEEMFYTPSAAETFELVGSITIPARMAFTITARGMWQNSRCHGVIISDRNSTTNGNEPYWYSVAAYFNEDNGVFFPSCTYSGNTGPDALTFYIWSKWQATNLNKVEVSGFYMPY